MSATHAPADAAVPAADEPAIVTEFRERLLSRYPECETVDAALRRAEQAASATHEATMPRCPECHSVRIRYKPGGDQPHRTDSAYVCSACRHHFDQPLEQEPLVEAARPRPRREREAVSQTPPGEQVTLGEVGDE